MENCRFRHVIILLSSVALWPSATGCTYNPVKSEYEVSLQDRKQLIKRAGTVYPYYTQISDGPLNDPELQTYVQQLGNEIAEASHDPALPFQFNVVNSSTPNVYTLPGGYISLTRGMLMNLDREAELAAVLAHEIGHAVARHPERALNWGRVTDIIHPDIFSLFGGNDDEKRSYVGLSNLTEQDLLASYSRSQEITADKLGMTYLSKVGYDPRGMVAFQETLLQLREEAPRAVEQQFVNHPMSANRVERARSRADKLLQNQPIDSDRQLNQFQKRVADVWKARADAYQTFDRGVTLARNGNFRTAKKQFRAAIERYEGEALFHAWLGVTELEQGQLDEASRALKRARELQADVFRVQLYSARFFLRTEAYERAMTHLLQAEELLPGTPSVTFFKGRIHEERNQHNLAAQQFLAYLETPSDQTHRKQYARNRLRQWGYLP